MTSPTKTDTGMAHIQSEIERRMSTGEPFTFDSLHAGMPLKAYRMADKTIQQWRKKGWISHTRKGREFVWSLTEAGRAAKATGAA